MPMYKIDLIQVRKMTVYCHKDNEDSAEAWVKLCWNNIIEHINDGIDENVYCFTTFNIKEDETNDLVHRTLEDDGATN